LEGSFVNEAKTLTWAETAKFRDATGQTGPATWKNGAYPEGQADYPVTGVSWYEAAAYADFAGKSLPSIYHWNRASTLWLGHFVVPLSNFTGREIARAGSFQGMSAWGAYDMAGNAKEWCLNESSQGKRYILGGGWSEPEYLFPDPDAQSPFDRLATYGFRCIKSISTNTLTKGVFAPVVPAYRDYAKENPSRTRCSASTKVFSHTTRLTWRCELKRLMIDPNSGALRRFPSRLLTAMSA
jgi:hypothetical protein